MSHVPELIFRLAVVSHLLPCQVRPLDAGHQLPAALLLTDIGHGAVVQIEHGAADTRSNREPTQCGFDALLINYLDCEVP